MPEIFAIHSLLLTLVLRTRQRRSAETAEARRAITAQIQSISEIVGLDVVDRIDRLTFAEAPVALTVFDGAGCSKSKKPLKWRTCLMLRVTGAAPCDHCDEIFFGSCGALLVPPFVEPGRPLVL